MNSKVPIAFALLGVVVGVVSQLQSVAHIAFREAGLASLSLAFSLLGVALFLFSTVAVAVVGYGVGRGVDLPEEFVEFTAVAGITAGFGALVGGAFVVVAVLFPATDTIIGFTVGVVYDAVTWSISIGLTGLAGAAVAHFSRSPRKW